MPKIILITGATDGIGQAAVLSLSALGHTLLIHGRSAQKLAATAAQLRALPGAGPVETWQADLSDLAATARFGREICAAYRQIDVLINNAGVYKVEHPVMGDGQDIRFVVNTMAPALLTRLLLGVIPTDGRIIHLSSAAQAPVDLKALAGGRPLDPMAAYAQSKLALTMWSQALAAELGPEGPATIAVNPGSLLATNMVRKGFGVAGNDIGIGADILARAALSDEFAQASGRYFDNDAQRFAPPHNDAADAGKVERVVEVIEARIAGYLGA
ncbi:SDR family NAD(P)-dependent oxidoreductase [Maricaulis sp.]|uniref:SDR family NAD(P)-dependent oxidoreductase n=1 Tax=Maricaulis sp. TaxID=1486257 RepID=UPI003A93C04F